MSTEATTVLITDMEGSTAFTAAEGDESALELIRIHESIVRRVLARHGGREIKSMGDGFLLTFTAPSAAIACALELMDDLATHNREQPSRPLLVRMGMNCGSVIEDRGDVYGTTVNAASRIAAKARSGQVLVSEAVRDAASSNVDCAFVDRGLFWLKGLREQWRLYEATTQPVEPYRPAIAEGRTPFVDRDLERARLRRFVDDALEGRGGVVLLGGEPGAGKSRLADEMGAEAHGRGMHHLVGRCYEVTQNQPYTPLVEVLETIERRLDPSAFRAALGEAAGDIARLLPQIRRRYPDLPPPAELPPEQERRFVFASTQHMLERVAAVRPLFIVWDDVHHADASTLAFLDHLALEIATLPILIVATYTYGEVTPARPLRATIETLRRRRLVHELEVGVLRHEDMRTLLGAIGDTPPPDALVDVLYRDTEGNVFFFEEVVRHLIDRQLLFDDYGHWLAGVENVALEVPETLRLTIRRRLESLTDAARQMLMRAALIGRGFGWDLLDAITEDDEDTLLDALDEAERARLIASTIDAGRVRFRFSHELIRQALIDELSLARRQRLHQRIADAMEIVYSQSLEEHADAIAAHLERSGDRDADRSVRFLLMAGERDLEAAAYEDARRHLDRALTLLPANDTQHRGRVLLLLGQVARSLGRPDDAITTWHDSLDAFEAAGDRDAVAALCLDAGIQVAWWIRGREAGDLIRRGLAALGDRTNATRAGLIGLSAALASQAGAYERAEELFAEALSIADEHPDKRILGMIRYMHTTHLFTFNEFARAIAAGAESVDDLRDSGELWNLANVYGYMGASAMWLGHFEDSNRFGAEGEAIATRLGNWSALIFCERAQIYPAFGAHPDLDWYLGDGQRAFDLGLDQNFRWLQAIGQTRMGLARFWKGDWEQSLAHFEEAAILEGSGATGGHAGGLILCDAYLGRRDKCLALLSELAPTFDVATMRSESLALFAIEAYAMLGLHHEAAALYPLVMDRMERGIVGRGWDNRLMWTLAGIAAACGGDWDAAEDHFTVGLERTASLPLRLEEGDVCRFHAWMLQLRDAAGDAERADELLDQAIAAYQRIGMAGHERLAHGMRRQR